jgi:hypothetical protein
MLDINKYTSYDSFWSNENKYSSAPKKVSNWIELEEG